MHPKPFLAALTAGCCLTASGLRAQTTPGTRPSQASGPEQKATAPQQKPEDPPVLYELRPGMYVYPAPYSPDYWSPIVRPYEDYSSHRRRRLSGRRHPRLPYRSFGRSFYGPRYGSHGYGYGQGYGYSPYGGDVHAAYEQGRYDADHEYIWYIASRRAGRLLNQYGEIFDEAIIMFRDGQYDWAAIKLLGAAEKNHGSASSRLHAGHALFALGRYSDATELIARAFELAPSLAHKQYDIRDEYGNKSDFDRHLAALKTYVARHPDEARAVTLLGYVTYYTEGPGASYTYFDRAIRLEPSSYFIPKLWKLARIAAGLQKERAGPAEGKGKTSRSTGKRDLATKPPFRRVKAVN